MSYTNCKTNKLKMKKKIFVSIYNISENTEIPNEFLAKIFSELKKAGIVDSGRGKFGGFNLTKKS